MNHSSAFSCHSLNICTLLPKDCQRLVCGGSLIAEVPNIPHVPSTDCVIFDFVNCVCIFIAHLFGLPSPSNVLFLATSLISSSFIHQGGKLSGSTSLYTTPLLAYRKRLPQTIFNYRSKKTWNTVIIPISVQNRQKISLWMISNSTYKSVIEGGYLQFNVSLQTCNFMSLDT